VVQRQPTDFLLSQADGSNRSVIKMSARYVPVNIKLEPRESINNMGVLRVDVVDAKGLRAADRSGKSDPYVVFTLNGAKVFKSETKKKTLTPVWNESFEVMIPSRVSAQFDFEISDWDRVGTSTHLGSGHVDLASLEPFEGVEVELPVTHQRDGAQGAISLRMLFQPESGSMGTSGKNPVTDMLQSLHGQDRGQALFQPLGERSPLLAARR